jgi:CHASE3 domain sensor protein
MKLLKRILLIGLASILTSQSSFADEPTLEECVMSCNEALRAADDLLIQMHQELNINRELNKMKSEEIDLLKVRVSNQEKELNSWYRNPLIMTAVGLIIGGIAVGAAGR